MSSRAKLLRVASSLPVGNEKRRRILSGLRPLPVPPSKTAYAQLLTMCAGSSTCRKAVAKGLRFPNLLLKSFHSSVDEITDQIAEGVLTPKQARVFNQLESIVLGISRVPTAALENLADLIEGMSNEDAEVLMMVANPRART